MKPYLLTLSLLLAALMLIGCASALAETTTYKELGLAIDFSAIQDKSANCPFLKNWGVGSRDPFLSSMGIYFVLADGNRSRIWCFCHVDISLDICLGLYF